MVGIEKIGRAISGKAILLEPGVRDDRASSLEFIGAHINGAIDQAGVVVEIRGTGDDGIVARVDTRGAGLQAQVAGGVSHEERRVGDVANSPSGIRRGATVIKRALSGKVVIGSI